MSSLSETELASRWAAFQNAAFMKYWLSRLAAGFAVQIQTVAVGWQVYDLTRDPLDLGFVGLSQFLPALLLVLVTGACGNVGAATVRELTSRGLRVRGLDLPTKANRAVATGFSVHFGLCPKNRHGLL